MPTDQATRTRTPIHHGWHTRMRYMGALLALICASFAALEPAQAQGNGLPSNWREDKALLEYAKKHFKLLEIKYKNRVTNYKDVI